MPAGRPAERPAARARATGTSRIPVAVRGPDERPETLRESGTTPTAEALQEFDALQYPTALRASGAVRTPRAARASEAVRALEAEAVWALDAVRAFDAVRVPAGWESVLRFAFAPTCTRALFALLTPLAFLAFLAERFLSELFADPAMPLPFGGRAVSAAAAAERRFWGFLGATTEGRGALDVRFASSNERIFACLAKGWCSFCIVLRLW